MKEGKIQHMMWWPIDFLDGSDKAADYKCHRVWPRHGFFRQWLDPQLLGHW